MGVPKLLRNGGKVEPGRPHHSPTTAPPQPHHGPTTAPPQPHHSPTTAAPQPHHSVNTPAPQTHHSPTPRLGDGPPPGAAPRARKRRRRRVVPADLCTAKHALRRVIYGKQRHRRTIDAPQTHHSRTRALEPSSVKNGGNDPISMFPTLMNSHVYFSSR